MNKYLEKIASTTAYDDEAEIIANRRLLAGMGMAGGGYLAREQLKDGNLTGRRTLYHGSSESATNSIRQHGLVPNKNNGISALVGLTEANKDLVFAEKRRFNAHLYTVGQENINNGTRLPIPQGALADPNKPTIPALKQMLSGNNKNITHINLPDWKQGLQGVENPEYTKYLKSFERAMDPNVSMTDKAMKSTFADGVHVAKGGISTDYIKGSNTYTKNSLKEVREYISHNRGRFAGGVGKAALGLAAIGGGAAYLKHTSGSQGA